MITPRKEYLDAARHRQEKRETNETSKVIVAQRSVEPAKLNLDESEESYTGTRRTETCIAPRCVNGSLGALLAICSFRSLCYARLVFYVLLLLHYNSSVRGGGGVRCPTLYFSSLFSVQQTPGGIGSTSVMRFPERRIFAAFLARGKDFQPFVIFLLLKLNLRLSCKKSEKYTASAHIA